MSTRTVTITVSRTVEYVDTHEIDWDNYLAWLDGDQHTDVLLAEYIDAGSDARDIIHGVVERGRASEQSAESWISGASVQETKP